jgi:acetate kinase
MNDVVLVLNAGSSSLKFCVYRADRSLSIDLKGQIDGIGTNARYAAESGGAKEARALPGVKDARGALQSLAEALRGHYRGRATVRAVGHRVARSTP